MNGNGVLTATGVNISGTISASTGDIGGWQIGTDRLYKRNESAVTALYPNSNNDNAVIFIGSQDTPNTLNANTNFKVTGKGAVYFKGGIYGWSNGLSTFRPGLSLANLYLNTLNGGNQISVEINQGLIVDISQ